MIICMMPYSLCIHQLSTATLNFNNVSNAMLSRNYLIIRAVIIGNTCLELGYQIMFIYLFQAF